MNGKKWKRKSLKIGNFVCTEGNKILEIKYLNKWERNYAENKIYQKGHNQSYL